MTIPGTLERFLQERNVAYDVIEHFPTSTSRETARAADIPPARLAKAVLMRDGQGYLLAVLPAAFQVEQAAVWRLTHRSLDFASEDDAARLFRDCERGALPALAPAYGLDAVVDEHLDHEEEVWLEAGDHRHLIHLSGDAFKALMQGARHGCFCHA
jgi:Ala-tRNA(Pro) deacylase